MSARGSARPAVTDGGRAAPAETYLRPDGGIASRPAWHALSPEAALGELAVEARRGLSAAEARRRLGLYGRNRLAEARSRPWWRFFARQFLDVLVLVLVAAAVLSGIVGDPLDTLAIVVIVLLNALVGAFQEYRADRALAALKEALAPTADVRRDGRRQTLPADDLVPGDLVLLEAGGVVPADLRLVRAADLQLNEAALTGESLPVDKDPQRATGHDAPLAERPGMAFKGTQVIRGRALGVVVGTGSATELGAIAELLQHTADTQTPLQRRLTRFSRRLALIILVICALVFWLGWLRGEPPLLALMTAISLAVAAIPEALPAVVTVSLAVGAMRMSRRNALIRRLPAVETLGSVSHICTDKTGTLTLNAMRLDRFAAPEGDDRSWAEAAPPEALVLGLALNHDAVFQDGAWQGDPTELALVEAALARGVDPREAEHRHPRIETIAFSSERQRMTTVHEAPGGGFVAWTKGAPEAVIPRCTAPDEALRQRLAARADRWAGEGYRVLAMAMRAFDTQPAGTELEAELTLLGLVGLIDPPRPEAAAAVEDCRRAGISPVLVTGDHPGTALAIARRVGIVGDEARAVTGRSLDAMDARERAAALAEHRVFARVSPQHKIDIVTALQAHHGFVAMTGDGVNDAPALKRADIGVAMGRKGTEVAREAADMVLLDDNFASIVAAVREGRRVYDNIRKFVAYTMTSNAGELATLLAAPLLGLPLPLLPLQILWINLVTDGLPGLAMAAEPGEPDLMRRPPRPPRERLFSRALGIRILWVGLMMAALCVGLQAWALGQGSDRWQTMVFTVLTLSQLFNALALRHEVRPLWAPGFFANRWLLGAIALTVALQLLVIYLPAAQRVFRTVALSASELGLCLVLAAAVMVALEVDKAVRRALARPGP